MNFAYTIGLIVIFIIACLLSYLSIYKTFIYSPVAKQVFIDPDLHSKAVDCLSTPKKCTQNNDCKNSCLNTEEMICQEMSRSELQAKKFGKTGGKYCLPKKADQPCNENYGGMWTWSGYSGLDGTTAAQQWDCLCTLPEIAAGNGCPLNNNICKGGEFTYDARGEQSNTPPLPVHCKCPEGNVKIWAENGSILCIPFNPGYCADEQGTYNKDICSNFFSNPNDTICGIEPKSGVNDCGFPAPKPNYEINKIMCTDLVDKKNKTAEACIPQVNSMMATRGVSKCSQLSVLDLSRIGKKCGGIPDGYTENIIDKEKKNLCDYINTTTKCNGTLKGKIATLPAPTSPKTTNTCKDLDFDDIYNIGINCNAFGKDIISI